VAEVLLFMTFRFDFYSVRVLFRSSLVGYYESFPGSEVTRARSSRTEHGGRREGTVEAGQCRRGKQKRVEGKPARGEGSGKEQKKGEGNEIIVGGKIV
jgi:hypothetical protein